VTGILDAALVLAVWAGASAVLLVGLRNLAVGGAVIAAAATAGLLALHGAILAGAVLGAAGVATAFWLRPAPGERSPQLLPPGSAPTITLCVVIGALAVWIGGSVLSGPGGTAGRAAALVLLGLGAIRSITASDPARLPPAALLLALGLSEVAALEPVAISLHAPVLGAALAAAVAALLTFGAAPGWRPALRLFVAAAVGLAVIVAEPSLALLGLVPLLLAFAQLRAGRGAFCLRSAALAAGLLGVAALAAAPAGGDRMQRLAALATALAAAAAAGVLPHLMELEDSPDARAAFLRRALLAPAFVLALTAQVAATLAPAPARIFGGTLVAIGALNVAAGLVGALGADRLRAWRAAYLAEWGLVLISLGLLNSTGAAAAYLLLLSMLLLRLPPGAWLAAAGEAPRSGRARGVLLALALAGGPPFAAFAARVLLLRGATALAWPLALGVGLALAAWLPVSWRLGHDLRRPPRRFADLAQLAGLAATAAIGIYPAAVLRPVGLG